MFQTFRATTTPDQGPPRLAALRSAMADEGIDAFLVPRADAHQGEYVAARDERLAWLTGFTGSAGIAALTRDAAGIFVDGRYRLQVRVQVAGDFTPVDWPATRPEDWLATRLPRGAVLGFDAWLHTAAEVERMERKLAPAGVVLRPCENLIDRIWTDQPSPPAGHAEAYPVELAGRTSTEKRAELGRVLREAGQMAAVLTLPDSISWLLNLRGRDLPQMPVLQAFAILHADGIVDLFADPAKLEHVDPGHEVRVLRPDRLAPALAALRGPVRVDKATAPLAVSEILTAAGIEVAWGEDPCILPKARKTPAEIAGTREAHLRDGAAMVEFLCWLDTAAPGGKLTEIEVVKKLETFRRATNALRGISFDTICGAGEHGAIVHYRVTEETDRPVRPGELLLIDSGGQYLDGTTDITRTVAVGAPTAEMRDCFTRVLKGMIAISRARWPRGLAGRDLDPLARAALWRAGLDYDHGTGHGVGVFLGVHEGPQRISRISEIALEPGMILSNEPGYYREGAFGIRIENLVVVEEAPKIGDGRDQLAFETLTYVPIDLRLVEPAILSPGERGWLNAYHAEVARRIGPRVGSAARDWLMAATRAI
ncbi:aminopeptidase P family protein [Palleronia sp. KMU-117]|uniref:aminopeptidase P family protein n=1 Tax=Palleronia sp. KMU-117 TaxID=3434108 RepID=UPI003D7629CD